MLRALMSTRMRALSIGQEVLLLLSEKIWDAFSKGGLQNFLCNCNVNVRRPMMVFACDREANRKNLKCLGRNPYHYSTWKNGVVLPHEVVISNRNRGSNHQSSCIGREGFVEDSIPLRFG